MSQNTTPTPSLSDTLIAAIRTGVPILVGSVLGWLVSVGIELDSATQTAVVTAVTGLSIAGYWLLATWLARRVPALGWLLGYPSAPTYPAKETEPESNADDESDDSDTPEPDTPSQSVG